MPDNITTAGGTFAYDDVGGVMHPRAKLEFGPDGSATDVSPANPLPVVAGGAEYETVAASATAQTLGATGATGDFLAGVLIIPATPSPGAVAIKDGSGSAITIFTGGSSSVSSLVPFFVPVGAKSTAGAWQVTTGANVSAIGFGDFT